MQSDANKSSSRREFLKKSGGVVAGAALANAIAARSYAAASDTIKIALVGCGGRGGGAAVEALSTKGPTQLVAMADVFQDRLTNTLRGISAGHAKQVDVPRERQFLGFDGYKKAVDAVGPGGLVIFATPPAFRPMHVEYAVEKGCHIFMEKSFAVDGPGLRRMMKAGEAAKAKNLKVAGGLMCRHNMPLEDAITKIHDGMIGEVITCWAYREHGPVGFNPRRNGENELMHQIRNYSNFTWMNGSFLLDWLIHNLDTCCWVKNDWPVSAQGHGGRQTRTEPDQLFDNYAMEYHFPDGTRLFAQGRHINGCWNFFGSQIHGAKGSAVLGEGINKPQIFKGHKQTRENIAWAYEGADPNPYQHEHDLLFDAIRSNKPYNEADRCVKAAMVGIMGRMAAESGRLVTAEEVMASNFQLAPELDQMSWDAKPPVEPDGQGRYPVAMPGKTKNY
jgi:predicted dehydrogenase